MFLRNFERGSFNFATSSRQILPDPIPAWSFRLVDPTKKFSEMCSKEYFKQ